MPTDTGIVPVNYRASMGANFYWTKTHGAYKRHLVQKIERVLSNRFTIALLGRVELWYTSCADSGNNILATQLAVVRRCQAGLGGVLLIFQQNMKIEKTLIKRPI